MTEPASRRVFFALWPPEATLQALDDLAGAVTKQCGGRRMRRDTLHLTLAFIGAASPGQIELLRQVAAGVRGVAFDWILDRLECWPRNRIAWAGCSQMPSCQRRLFDALAGSLKQTGFELDQRPFIPHVTLARNVRCVGLPEFARPIHWQVSDFFLAESVLLPSGARYRLLDRWPLLSAPEKKSAEGC